LEGYDAIENEGRELVLFLSQGIMAWLYMKGCDSDNSQTTKAIKNQRCYAGLLAILIANMIES